MTLQSIYYQNLFNQAIQDCTWLKHKGFTVGDVSSASMDAFALHNLFRILNDANPMSILEFGLGQSSKLIHQYANYYGVRAVTVESDTDWDRWFKGHADGIQLNTLICPTRSVDCGESTRDVFDEKYLSSLYSSSYDLIVIDAPCAFDNPEVARTEVLDFVENLLSPYCIFIHDSERRGEREMISRLLKKLPKESLRREYEAVKNHMIITHPKWRFLTSL